MTVNNKLINFKFEKFDYNYSITFQRNLYSGNFANFINQTNYRPSQVVEHLFCIDQSNRPSFNNLQAIGIDEPSDHYIISTAVSFRPNDWTDKTNKFSPFELLIQVFGVANAKHARTAVGVAELPLNAPVEIELIVELKQLNGA